MLSIIVAMSDCGVIGNKDALPWRIPSDLKRFRQYTLGKSVVMGRRTYHSLPGPLVGRHVIVVGKTGGINSADVTFVRSPEEALTVQHRDTELMIAGGSAIFAWFFEHMAIDRMYVTRVFADIRGDAHFPAIAWDAWHREHRSDISQCAGDDHPTQFEVWRRSAS
ncbi:MAG: dihydrofolate reductase [Candidatus Pacebacteria bacterium]|nr:dihydrofolate reductase [Candidatus Paceibacterota bacterium]